MPHPDFAEMMGRTLSDTVHEVIGYDRPDVEVLETVAAGHPAQALVDASALATLLVVGSRGHGGFAGTLLGAGSQQCAQRPLPGGRRAGHELIASTVSATGATRSRTPGPRTLVTVALSGCAGRRRTLGRRGHDWARSGCSSPAPSG
jgi:hypothetical protein